MATALNLLKAGLYRIWCGVNRLGYSGVHTLGDTSAFVNPAGQLLLTRPFIKQTATCRNT